MRHLPLIKWDPDMLILQLVAIPELHLVLGTVIRSWFWQMYRTILGVPDKLISEFKRNVFDGTSGNNFIALFYKKVILIIFFKLIFQ